MEIRASIRDITINVAALNGPGGTVQQGLEQACRRTVDRTKQNITQKRRIDTGRMRNSVDYEILGVSGGRVQAQVRINTRYAIYQEEGTTGPIRPRRATFLRFRPAGSSTFVFARQVRGVRPMNALRDAVADLSPDDFTIR